MNIGAVNRGLTKGETARANIKAAARALFIQYGIGAVTIRDIAREAGQRNGGSVNYYFRSKDDLVREILNDVAEQTYLDEARALQELEASGKELTVRDLLKVIMVGGSSQSSERMRLYTMLQNYNRDMMHTEIPGRWDKAYQRCVQHLRKLVPTYPDKVFQQRLYFLVPYLWTFLATREGGEQRAQFWKEFWNDPSSMESLLDTAEGILMAPASPDTLSVL